MSQRQPQRPRPEKLPGEEPIKYGDVFSVSGQLASKTIAPGDAATAQAAENKVLRQTPKGSAASVMESAAAKNKEAGLVGYRDATYVGLEQGFKMFETFVDGDRIIREAVGGQVVGHIVEPEVARRFTGAVLVDNEPITIGEALEATAISAADKPVNRSDAAAIQAAEMRATGLNQTRPGSVAAAAQAAASINVGKTRDEDKAKLSNVLGNAIGRMPGDKAVTREDAEGVMEAEIRNKPFMNTTRGGVAASMAAAARINQND